MFTNGVVGAKQEVSVSRSRIIFMRIGAGIIDLLVLSCLQIWLSSIYGVVNPRGDQAWFDGDGFSISMPAAALIGPLYLYGIVFVYFFIQEVSFGTTIGKRLFGLQVIGVHGERLTILSASIRNILRIIDSLPILYIIGLISGFFSPTFQRLGDRAARTVVLPIRSTQSAAYSGSTTLKRYALLCLGILIFVGYSLDYSYYKRPPLVIDGWVNINNAYTFPQTSAIPACGEITKLSGDYVIGRHVRLLQTYAPEWHDGTVTYPIEYADKVVCSGEVTLQWNDIFTGWSVAGVQLKNK